MKMLTSLKREHKETVGLLQIGTFLEYFDLMLYVHMAVLLNELFFPKTDPHTAALLSAFAFCSTYVFRPFGALFFGYIGDHIGRKSVIILSTSLMAVSCFFMSILPTYAEVGIFASVGMITCRILQSFAATGEVIGAEIYLSEILKPPASYQLVSWVAELCTLGSIAALLASSLVFKCNASWRAMFVLGSMIALSGAVARRKLRETPAFLKHKNKSSTYTSQLKFPRKTAIAYFFIYSGVPLCFYVTFIFGADILKHSMHYTTEQIINHNLLLAIFSFCIAIYLIILVKKVSPLKILKVRAILSLIVFLMIPFLLISTNIYSLTTVQVLLCAFSLETTPAIPIFFKYFPVQKRFTYSSMLYALSRAFMYMLTSFSFVFLTKILGFYGMWLIMLPISLGFFWGIKHFEELERMQIVDSSTLQLAA